MKCYAGALTDWWRSNIGCEWFVSTWRTSIRHHWRQSWASARPWRGTLSQLWHRWTQSLGQQPMLM